MMSRGKTMVFKYLISTCMVAAALSACQETSHITAEPTKETTSLMIIKKPSPYTAGQTIDRLEKILISKGLKVFTRVDHAAGAKSVDIEMMDSELIIFGNPKLGTPLMLETPQMGLDLPLKALAFTDASGQTYLTYVAPKTLQSRHGISANSAIIEKMTGALDAMTNKAVEAE
ncbi:MAG: DUF302 domain-containing protein [Maricaulaceae bacterium]